jgi:hypothetical protein
MLKAKLRRIDMPVLHKYKDKSGYYIRTSIKGSIINFHLTTEGYNKILKAGIAPEQPFGRALLLDLYRSGEVFTHKSGPSEATGIVNDERQTNIFDILNDPDPEKMFPSCASCSSIQDLHLVEVIAKDHLASILCGECRSKKADTFDTSIPLTPLDSNEGNKQNRRLSHGLQRIAGG